MNIKKLSREQQYLSFLKVANWYEGRKTDISKYKDEAHKRCIKLSKNAKKFLEAYVDLVPYIQFSYEAMGEETFYHFNFNLNIETASRCYASDEYKKIAIFASEKCLCLGEFGYYYPGVLAISESGILYLKHDYNDHVQEFSTMIELIESELKTGLNLLIVKQVND